MVGSYSSPGKRYYWIDQWWTNHIRLSIGFACRVSGGLRRPSYDGGGGVIRLNHTDSVAASVVKSTTCFFVDPYVVLTFKEISNGNL